MHGLDPYIQGRRPRIITEGAAWMPGSRPGMTSAGGSRLTHVVEKMTDTDRFDAVLKALEQGADASDQTARSREDLIPLRWAAALACGGRGALASAQTREPIMRVWIAVFREIAALTVMAGHSPPKDGRSSERPTPGHPRRPAAQASRTLLALYR